MLFKRDNHANGFRMLVYRSAVKNAVLWFL
nr:MAG TPA: hypothetical protein [Caudoviricetes sp.]